MDLNVTIDLKSNSVQIDGSPEDVARVEQVFTDFDYLRAHGQQVFNGELTSMLRVLVADPSVSLRQLAEAGKQRSVGNKRQVQPKSVNQRQYLEAIEQSDMVFGIGPAGTGKTYLAVAMAISALVSKKVARIILARPAVEAGERLGFLPGTLQEKVDPYLRPLYDALYDLLEPEKVDRLLEKNVIEIAPIAFMRGRTLNDAFVILDEAQNTTSEQMKMFVTRLGFNSKAVITGDVTQIDLPNPNRSGLIEAMNVLQGVEGIRFQFFTEVDVVRHHLVQRIIRAYEDFRARDDRQLTLQLEGDPTRPPAGLEIACGKGQGYCCRPAVRQTEYVIRYNKGESHCALPFSLPIAPGLPGIETRDTRTKKNERPQPPRPRAFREQGAACGRDLRRGQHPAHRRL